MWALLFPLGSAAGLDSPRAPSTPVAVAILREPEVNPAGFSTWSYRLENRMPRSVTLDLVLDLPGGWYAVTPARSVVLDQSDVRNVPFTVWVPGHAQADSAHVVHLRVRLPQEEPAVVTYRHEVRVKPVPGIQVRSLDSGLTGRTGRTSVARFTVTNTGNRSGLFDLEASSIPDWPVSVSPRRVKLSPGERVEVEIRSPVPDAARSHTMQILRLTARGDPDGTGEVHGHDQVRMTVLPGRQPGSLHARLPLRMAVSAGELEPGRGYTGLRLASSGNVNQGTRFDLDLDLATAPRSRGVTGWQSQRVSFGLRGADWGLTLGDMTQWFPDLAARSLSGRGIGLTASRGEWTGRFFGGRNRAVGNTTSLGAGAAKRLRPGFSLAGDLLLLEEEAGRLGIQRSRLACATATADSLHGWSLRMEGALSQKALAGTGSFGGAAQLFADRDGSTWLLRTRAYAGSEEFGGRTGDRDGFSAFFRTMPRPWLRMWSSGDMSEGRAGIARDAGLQRTGRIRAGSRLSHSWLPSLELTVGRARERGGDLDGHRDTERDDVTATLARQTGVIYSSLTGRWGTASDLRTGDAGRIQAVDVSAGGRIRRVRAAARYALSRDWSISRHRDMRTHVLTGDLSWGSRTGRVNAGLSIASRSVDAGQIPGNRRRDSQVQPRADLRISRNWNARVEASLFGLDEDPSLRRWQVQISYSAPSAIPAIWVPTQGRVEVVLFIDEDMDGEPGPGERRVSGVLMNVETHQEFTDPNGTARWPLLAPGTWWVELETASLPMGLSPACPLPMAVHVDPGRNSVLNIPLLRSGRVSGIVYLDESHDGKLTAGERSLSEMRVVLLQGDRVVKDSLTDENGRYELPGVHPGTYGLRVAEGWLPVGWAATGPVEIKIQVLPGRDVRVDPYGVAPRRKPLIRTFVGDEPMLLPGHTDSEKPAVPPNPEPRPGNLPDSTEGERIVVPTSGIGQTHTDDPAEAASEPAVLSCSSDPCGGPTEPSAPAPPIRRCDRLFLPALLKPGKDPDDFSGFVRG